MSGSRTLWEEGRQPGRRVVTVAVATSLLVVVVDLLVDQRMALLSDVAFVLVCAGAALTVRPRDFFLVGVLPPQLMAGTILVLSLVDRGAVANPQDGLVQSLVTGLAHHSGALGAGYALTLVLLALRQVAQRNAGAIRRRPAPRRTSSGVPS
jgi:hypothetical protein